MGASQLDAEFQTAPIGIGYADEHGDVIALNPEFGRLIGVRAHDALHRALEDLAPTNDGRWREVIAAAIQSGALRRRIITVGAPPGTRPLSVLAWAFADAQAGPLVVLLVHGTEADDALTETGALLRAQVARQIHDGLAQDLWLAKLTASKLARHPTLDPDAQKLCVELLRSIDSGLAEARTAVMAMRPIDGPTVTLAELIERQVHEFSDRFGIPAECRIREGPPVPSRVAVELLRVMQEALNNVRKHASARRVWIKARQLRGSVTLSIRDDGVGFDPGATGTGYGSQSMHERAQSLGGQLEIVSTPGRGTTVTIRVPVAQPSRLS